MWKIFEWLFRAWDSANKVAEKGLPSEKVNDAKFEIAKEKLSVKERRVVYNGIVTYLQMHPKEDIDLYVEIVCDSWSEDDKAEVKLALHKRFENRLHHKFKINT
jgi:hypothetical protein